jgi:LuxR family transcriptional regulator, maltose regulon positive regulatory protein
VTHPSREDLRRREPSVTLLESKLRPPDRQSVTLPRATVVERIQTARLARITLVEAPAGYGKTTLLANWVGRVSCPVGWYSIDEADNEPAVFLTYLACAFGRAGMPVRHAAEGIASQRRRVAAIVAELAAAFESTDEPAVVVLDDVHLLENRLCIDVLDALCEHVPAGSRLVLSTRDAQRLAVADVESRRAVLRVAIEDLRLSDVEADALLRGAGLELQDDDVRAVNARCEGWAAGLYLTALAGMPAVTRIRQHGTVGVDRFVGDYFRLEVLDPLGAEDREFLQQVAVLDRISGHLCDAMLGASGSAARLNALARSSGFLVEVDGERECFRLHPMLRDMLRAELDDKDVVAATNLLARATEWYEAVGDTDAAIGIADPDRVASLLPNAALPAFWTGRSATLGQWFASIDDAQLLVENPAAAILGAALLPLLGRPEAAERWGRAAFQCDPERVMPDGSPAAAWIANLRAFLCLDGAELMRDDAELSLTMLAGGSSMAANTQCLLGYAYLLLGDDERAAAWFEEAAGTAVSLGANVGASESLAAGSLLALATGDVRRAGDLAGRAYRIAQEAHLDDYSTTALVHVACGRAAFAEGRRKAACDWIGRADPLLPQVTYALPWLAVYVRLELAHLELALDNPARARVLLEEIDKILVRRPGLGVTGERVARLRHDLDAGRSAADGWTSELTPAELRLLPLLSGYLSFREIGERLDISRNTVKTQAISVYRKLDVASRSQAVARARELGLLSSDVERSG